MRITVTDERETPAHIKSFCYEGGIVSFVKYLNKNKEVLHPEPIYFTAKRMEDGAETGSVEIAMQYNDGYNENIFSFANNINTIEGGSHLVGFRSALTRVVNDYARKYKILKENDQNAFRRGYPRRAHRHHQRKAHRAPVRGADQNQTGQRLHPHLSG